MAFTMTSADGRVRDDKPTKAKIMEAIRETREMLRILERDVKLGKVADLGEGANELEGRASLAANEARDWASLQEGVSA